MIRYQYFHLCWDGALTPWFIKSPADYYAAFNLIGVCAAHCRVRILAFTIEDTHIHILMIGTYDDCYAFKIMFERSYHRHVTKTRGTLLKAKVDIDILPIDDENYLMNVGTYTLVQPTKDGKPVLPFDYQWGTASMYFRRAGHISVWRFNEDNEICAPVKAGSLSYSVVRKIACSKRRIPDDWMICNGFIMPENYVDVEQFENIYRTHNCYRTFLSSGNKQAMEVQKRMADYLGVSFDDSEAIKRCSEMSESLFGTNKVSFLDAVQRIELAQRLRKSYHLSFRQLSKLVQLPLSEIQKFVS